MSRIAQSRSLLPYFLPSGPMTKKQQDVAHKMVPIGVAQYMAYQPDIEQRVLHGGAVYAEQMASGPSIGPTVQQQYKDAQQREGQDDRGVILQPQG